MKFWMNGIPAVLTIALGFGAGHVIADGRALLISNLGINHSGLKNNTILRPEMVDSSREISYNTDGYKSMELNSEQSP